MSRCWVGGRLAQTGELAAAQLAYVKLRRELGVGPRLLSAALLRLPEQQAVALSRAYGVYKGVARVAVSTTIVKSKQLISHELVLAELTGSNTAHAAMVAGSGSGSSHNSQAAVSVMAARYRCLPTATALPTALDQWNAGPLLLQRSKARAVQRRKAPVEHWEEWPLRQMVTMEQQGQFQVAAAVERLRVLPGIALSALRECHAAALLANPSLGLLGVLTAAVISANVVGEAPAAEAAAAAAGKAKQASRVGAESAASQAAKALHGTAHSHAGRAGPATSVTQASAARVAGDAAAFMAAASNNRGRFSTRKDSPERPAVMAAVLELMEVQHVRMFGMKEALLPLPGVRAWYQQHADGMNQLVAQGILMGSEYGPYLSERGAHQLEHSGVWDVWQPTAAAAAAAGAVSGNSLVLLRYILQHTGVTVIEEKTVVQVLR